MICLTLKMKVLWSFETSGTSRPKTQRHIPEDLNIRNKNILLVSRSDLPYSLQKLFILFGLFVYIHTVTKCTTQGIVVILLLYFSAFICLSKTTPPPPASDSIMFQNNRETTNAQIRISLFQNWTLSGEFAFCSEIPVYFLWLCETIWVFWL